MKPRIYATITCAVIAIATALTISNGVLTAQGEQRQERSLDGVWLVMFTPRNCTTGAPIPNAAFETLYTFHTDKTMLASFRNNSATLDRTAAHGLWRRDLGWNQYSYKFVHIRRNVSTTAFAGKQESVGTLVLGDDGDTFTTEGFTTVFDAAGNPGNPSCSTSEGTRFTIDF